MNSSAHGTRKTRDFGKKYYPKYGRNSLNTLAPRIFSPWSLITRNRCEIILRAILEKGEGALVAPMSRLVKESESFYTFPKGDTGLKVKVPLWPNDSKIS